MEYWLAMFSHFWNSLFENEGLQIERRHRKSSDFVWYSVKSLERQSGAITNNLSQNGVYQGYVLSLFLYINHSLDRVGSRPLTSCCLLMKLLNGELSRPWNPAASSHQSVESNGLCEIASKKQRRTFQWGRNSSVTSHSKIWGCKYLRSLLQSNAGTDASVTHKITARWTHCRQTNSAFCIKQVPIELER